jgi:hypothetical protein
MTEAMAARFAIQPEEKILDLAEMGLAKAFDPMAAFARMRCCAWSGESISNAGVVILKRHRSPQTARSRHRRPVGMRFVPRISGGPSLARHSSRDSRRHSDFPIEKIVCTARVR